MRLSALAARVAADYLRTGDAAALAQYSGAAFRARFTSRLWMRRIVGGLSSPTAVEAACALLRVPPFNAVARHVFFGRGSFPDTAHTCGQPHVPDVGLSADARAGARV